MIQRNTLQHSISYDVYLVKRVINGKILNVFNIHLALFFTKVVLKAKIM